MTNRISRLKTALFANTREISLERALLYTASHRQTEGEPVILRRAKATAYILEHVEISIRDEELIAGNRTVKPRARDYVAGNGPLLAAERAGSIPDASAGPLCYQRRR
ncbi:pyruvate formate lyase family protein [Escherichia coli]